MKHRLFFLVSAVLLAGCSQWPYYKQSVVGHFAVTSAAQPIDSLIKDNSTDDALREKLRTLVHARQFAINRLMLPANDSYREFVDLRRNYVLQNLYAAEEFSTQLHTWCYPIIGCANYRGYFDEDMLESEEASLKAQGFDTYIGQVTAYSTLGWFDDPVLNTFTDLPEYRMVGLIFHELAHQELYLKNDTVFNESFATAVEQVGMAAYYSSVEGQQTLLQYDNYLRRRQTIVDSVAETRQVLAALYAQPLSVDIMRARKHEILRQLDTRTRQLTQRGEGEGEGEASAPHFNNARLGLFAAYNEHVIAFKNLLERHAGDFSAFYATVRKISELDPQAREKCLVYWSRTLSPPTQTPKERCAISTD